MLLTLPRVVGTDVDGEEITAQNGRYGPYLKKGSDSRSLQTEDQLLSLTEDEARAIYAQPKTYGRGRAAAAPLKELGDDPVSGKPIVAKDGRFGMYVTDGEYNATLRKDDSIDDPHPRARAGAAGRAPGEGSGQEGRQAGSQEDDEEEVAAKKSRCQEDGRQEERVVGWSPSSVRCHHATRRRATAPPRRSSCSPTSVTSSRSPRPG